MKSKISTLSIFLLFFITSFSQGEPGTFRYMDLNSLKWGIKDFSGKTIVEPQYSSMNPLKNGRYVVSKTSMQQGMIDEQSKEILSCEYFSISDVSKDAIIVRRDGKEGVLGILPLKYKSVLKGYYV